MEDLMEVIRAIRNRRSEMNVPPSKKAQLLFAGDKADQFVAMAPLLERLAYGSHVAVVQPGADLSGTVSVVTGPATVYIPLSELVDLEKEKARLQGKKAEGGAEFAAYFGQAAKRELCQQSPCPCGGSRAGRRKGPAAHRQAGRKPEEYEIGPGRRKR